MRLVPSILAFDANGIPFYRHNIVIHFGVFMFGARWTMMSSNAYQHITGWTSGWYAMYSWYYTHIYIYVVYVRAQWAMSMNGICTTLFNVCRGWKHEMIDDVWSCFCFCRTIFYSYVRVYIIIGCLRIQCYFTLLCPLFLFNSLPCFD